MPYFAGLTLARVLRPWGRRGEVAAEILTDFPQHLLSLRSAWLLDDLRRDRDARSVAIRSCRLHLGQAIFHFEGVDSISDAERLRGAEVRVPREQRMELPHGSYYTADLVGCSVWQPLVRHGWANLGTVREMQNSAEASAGRVPPTWLLVVDGPAGEILIPFAAEICTRIDLENRHLEVHLPEGLLELNAPQSRPPRREPG